MIEKIICNCNSTPCDGNQSSELEFKLNEDFKLDYQFLDSRFCPPMLIPLDSFDLDIEYYIKDREEVYLVTKTGSEVTNCILYPGNSVIKVIMSNHGLKAGYLWSRFTFKFPDQEYPNGYGRVVVDQSTGIKLINS